MHRFYRVLFLVSLFASNSPAVLRGSDASSVGPKTPDESSRCFRLADPNLKIELVVSEPDVVSPVAITWDAAHRMYVAEMLDYPLGPMRGRIRLLTDSDQDGRYEKVTVFADNLAFPTSVMPWRDGILVASAPDILFLRDTDADGQSDERRVVLTGFGEGNQQLRVNGLNYGLDNWIYGANGRSEGEIRRPDQPASEAVSIRRRDFRFRPDTGEIQAIVGFSQYGLPRDDWGNRFPSWNTIPIRHVVLDEPAVRSARFDSQAAVANIVDPADDGRVFSISPRPQTFNSESTDFYNAMCGLTIFRGHALGDSYCGQAFVGESLTNLVHRRALVPAGPTFIARRVDQNSEFLASTDNWFHPVFVTTGFDGALYVVDFYRRFVEHPNFAAAHLRQTVDWRDGAQHGRIWRIARRDQAPPKLEPRLADATTTNLVGALHHPNGWRRDTAQRMLVERQDRQAIPELRSIVREQTNSLSKLHALWTLQGLNGLDEDTLMTALTDADSRIRAHGVRLSGQSTYRSERLLNAINNMVDSRDPRLRLQVAQFLVQQSEFSQPERLAKLATASDADRWLLDVLGWGSDQQAWPMIQAVLAEDKRWIERPNDEQAQFLSKLASRVAAQKDDEPIRKLFEKITAQLSSTFPIGSAAMIVGIDAGLSTRQVSLSHWFEEPPNPIAKQLAAVSQAINAIADDPARIPSAANDRAWIVRLFRFARPDQAKDLAIQLLRSGESPAVRTAAADAIVTWNQSSIVDAMLGEWNRLTPSTRQIVQAACLRTPTALDRMISSLESAEISLTELDQATRLALERLPDQALRARAETLLRSSGATDRKQVLEKFESTLTLTGDVRRGADLFAKNCAGCHRIQGVGYSVGPDLSSIAARPKASLLVDVLDPSRQVSNDFVSYILLTKTGKAFVGLIAAETGADVTLKRAEGAQDTIARDEIEELRATGKSLMPDGLEQKLDQQALADLFEFLYRPDLPSLKQALMNKP